MRGTCAVVGTVTIFVIGGCTFPSTFHAIRAELAVVPLSIPLADPPGQRRFKGVIHVHTQLSHDSRGTEDDIVRAAKSAGLDFVMLTDHNRSEVFAQEGTREREGVLLIRGAEIRCGDRHILAVGLDRFIDSRGMTCPEVSAAVAEHGGVPLATHPSRSTQWDDPALVGAEVWDLYDEAKHDRWRYAAWALDILIWYGAYPNEILSRIVRRPDHALAAFDAQTTRRRLTAVGTPDAHQNIRVLWRQLDPYPLAFRLVPVYLLAAEGTRDALLDALRNGRAYFAFEVFKPAPSFAFRVKDVGGNIWSMGDEVPRADGLTVEVHAPASGRMTVFRDGHRVAMTEGDQLSLPVVVPGAYRAEVDISVQGQWRPWIFSNPIYVR
ncbi:MAG: CehA/McbA family metallohydrolase [Nitrospirota bacterium]